MKSSASLAPIPADLAARVRGAVNALGVRRTAEALGLTPQTLTRVLSGLPVLHGTRALVELAAERAPELRLPATAAPPELRVSTHPEAAA